MTTSGISSYDTLIVGGGIFGAYAALWLSQRGRRVCVVDKDPRLLSRASLVNQARLHAGYHYPRSIATARMADDHKDRFERDHREFVNYSFSHFYAVDRHTSFTNAANFERFCQYIGIPARRIESHPFIDTRRLEAVYRAVEYSFDPLALQSYYGQRVTDEKSIDVMMNTELIEAHAHHGEWEVILRQDEQDLKIRASDAINATYASINSVNETFGAPPLALSYELCEIALVSSQGIEDFALTVMDGSFCSLMPFGNSRMHSLSSVTYTPRRFSWGLHPEFSCQQERLDCTRESLGNCRTCPVRPKSSFPKMLSQLRQYTSPELQLHLRQVDSWFTVKTKLKASAIDDSRPTNIVKVLKGPDLYCLFSGKINSIYEIENAYAL